MLGDTIVHLFMWRVARVQPPKDVKWPMTMEWPWESEWGDPRRIIDRVKTSFLALGIPATYRPDRAVLSLELSESIVARARVFATSTFLTDARTSVNGGKYCGIDSRTVLTQWAHDLGDRIRTLHADRDATASAVTILAKLYAQISHILKHRLIDTLAESMNAMMAIHIQVEATLGPILSFFLSAGRRSVCQSTKISSHHWSKSLPSTIRNTHWSLPAYRPIAVACRGQGQGLASFARIVVDSVHVHGRARGQSASSRGAAAVDFLDKS